ncbi:uncharacterized protein LOC124985423 isoform X2 [Sciurus carolinensis]|uniref:uncharacterized protein LOC124985423 isoform X2 n=1 Tax=Sciurus carolinensis TaxID=30640 RepID=UPI001FB3EF72|nr:uncharacterized protein LOC124985423 isoform X2 [Sciurus carolinensis]
MWNALELLCTLRAAPKKGTQDPDNGNAKSSGSQRDARRLRRNRASHAEGTAAGRRPGKETSATQPPPSMDLGASRAGTEGSAGANELGRRSPAPAAENGAARKPASEALPGHPPRRRQPKTPWKGRARGDRRPALRPAGRAFRARGRRSGLPDRFSPPPPRPAGLQTPQTRAGLRGASQTQTCRGRVPLKGRCAALGTNTRRHRFETKADAGLERSWVGKPLPHGGWARRAVWAVVPRARSAAPGTPAVAAGGRRVRVRALPARRGQRGDSAARRSLLKAGPDWKPNLIAPGAGDQLRKTKLNASAEEPRQNLCRAVMDRPEWNLRQD